jgi:hypothetical protein
MQEKSYFNALSVHELNGTTKECSMAKPIHSVSWYQHWRVSRANFAMDDRVVCNSSLAEWSKRKRPLPCGLCGLTKSKSEVHWAYVSLIHLPPGPDVQNVGTKQIHKVAVYFLWHVGLSTPSPNCHSRAWQSGPTINHHGGTAHSGRLLRGARQEAEEPTPTAPRPHHAVHLTCHLCPTHLFPAA